MIKLLDILKEIKVDINKPKLDTKIEDDWGEGKIYFVDDDKFNLKGFINVNNNDVEGDLEFVNDMENDPEATEHDQKLKEIWINFLKKYKIPYRITNEGDEIEFVVIPVSLLKIK